MEDGRINVRAISKAVGISTERVYNILHERLEIGKVCARWGLRLVSSGQKRDRTDVSAQSLAKFNRNPQDFLRRFVTVDETWIHHYTPELTRWLPCHPHSGDSKSSHQATSPVFGWQQEFSSGRFPGSLTGISL